MKFKKGQRVVCVDDSKSNQTTMKNFKHWIEKGKTYTIRDQRSSGLDGGVLLEGIDNPKIWFEHLQTSLEPGYHPARFAPFDEDGYGLSDSEKEEKVLANLN